MPRYDDLPTMPIYLPSAAPPPARSPAPSHPSTSTYPLLPQLIHPSTPYHPSALQLAHAPAHVQPGGPQHRGWVAGSVVVAMAMAVLVIVVSVLVARPASAPAVAAVPAIDPLTWTTVSGQPVPVHSVHGPHEETAGMARGFTQDEPGAALAAIHIAARLTVANRPEVFEAVAREQCVGPVEAEIEAFHEFRDAGVLALPEGVVPEGYWYVTVLDPRREKALVLIAMPTPEARSLGAEYIERAYTMRWIDGDWKLEVPVSAPTLSGSVAGYEPLGTPQANL